MGVNVAGLSLVPVFRCEPLDSHSLTDFCFYIAGGFGPPEEQLLAVINTGRIGLTSVRGRAGEWHARARRRMLQWARANSEVVCNLGAYDFHVSVRVL